MTEHLFGDIIGYKEHLFAKNGGETKKTDGNILERGEKELKNFCFLSLRADTLKRVCDKKPSPEAVESMKREAAKARATMTALFRLTDTEFTLIDALYFGSPFPTELLCGRLGCREDELEGLAKSALESFCIYRYGEK